MALTAERRRSAAGWCSLAYVDLALPALAQRRVEVTLTAAPARLSLVPGRDNRVFAYNGHVPRADAGGARRRPGHRPLPERAARADHDPLARHCICRSRPTAARSTRSRPAARYDYVFTIPPGTAGHLLVSPASRTIARATRSRRASTARSSCAPPTIRCRALREKLLILSDNRFAPTARSTSPDPITPGRPSSIARTGAKGTSLFVNGAVMPTLTIRARRGAALAGDQCLGAPASTGWRSRGTRFLHVGNDGGLFERPVEVDEILLAIGERVGAAGARHRALRAIARRCRRCPTTATSRRRGPPTGTGRATCSTLHIHDEPPVARRALPATLRPVPPLDPARATATRLMVLTQGFINGRPMDLRPRGRQGAAGRHGDLGDREPGGDGPPVPPARLPVPGAGSQRRARAVPQLEGHGERAEARDGALHRALRRSTRASGCSTATSSTTRITG